MRYLQTILNQFILDITVYLPLAGSDDEGKPGKKRKQNKDEDDNWSPRVKVGRLNPREHMPTRIGARREHVEKGLEKAAAKLATVPEVFFKHFETDIGPSYH